jgi:hypothetical protein
VVTKEIHLLPRHAPKAVLKASKDGPYLFLAVIPSRPRKGSEIA